MPEINQTNRTILFEKFTEGENGNRLDSILGTYENRNERFNYAIKTLICHSYEEFLEKFAPVYYDIVTLQEDDEIGKIPVYDYALTNRNLQNPDAQPHNLCNQAFFKTIDELYTAKKTTSKNNLDFNHDEITKRAYDTETAMKDILDIRRELKYHMEKYMRLKDTNGSTNEINIHARAIKKLRKHITEEYTSNSIFNAIPLLIRQTELEIEYRQKNTNYGDSRLEDSRNMKIDYYIDDKGDFQTTYVEIPSQDTLLIETSAEYLPETKIYEILSKDYDNKQSTKYSNESGSKFIRDMHLALFTESSTSLKTLSDAQLDSNLQKYSFMYEKSNENFSKNILPLVEKIMNVKAFFDHAGEGCELIVANCTIEELMKATHRKKFEEFLKDAGEEATDNRIWLSIIPAVFHKDIDLTGPQKEESLDSDDEESNNTLLCQDLVSFETLTQALDILGKCRIITFFNYKGCEATSQALLTKEKVKSYKKDFAGLSKEVSKYAVFCYPNFTVLPKRNTTVEYRKGKKIELSSVYLDASYIACGLTALTQKSEVLKEKGFEINKSLCPPVRFDFEGSFMQSNDMVALRHIFPTKLNRESLLSWSSDLRQEINEDGGFGFCFCCDMAGYMYKNISRQQDHTYVYCARTLNKEEHKQPNGEIKEYYYPLFSAFTKTYVANFYKLNNPKGDNQHTIIRAKCDEWNAASTSKRCINNIVYSPKYSGVGIEEEITFYVDGQKPTYKIIHDKNQEDCDVTIQY